MPTMEVSRLQIRRFRTDYLVSAGYATPERLKDHLDEAITKDLIPVLSDALSSWFSESDSSIWIIRRLEFEVAVNAAAERNQITRAITTQIGKSLSHALLDGSDADNVIHFPNRAAYLARFLYDLSGGDAWNNWCYESFTGLRLLPTSSALRTAICEDPATGGEALQSLPPYELNRVIQTLSIGDASRILDTLADASSGADVFHCLEAAWQALLTIGLPLGDGDGSQLPLHLYVTAARDAKDVGGGPLRLASVALSRLAHRLLKEGEEANARLVRALTGNDLPALLVVAGAADGEALLPLLHCPSGWIQEVAGRILKRDVAQATVERDGGELRDTMFGGLFVLLPALDECPLAECARGWPNLDEAAAVSLIRFLLMIKSCGRERAHRVFYDRVLRDLLLIPQSVSLAALSEWQNRLEPPHLAAFLRTLLDWNRDRDAITGKKVILTAASLSGDPVATLIDGERGLWLAVVGASPGASVTLVETLRDHLSRLSDGDGTLLCDPLFFDLVRNAFPSLRIISLDDEAAVEAGANVEPDIGGILARLHKVPHDLSHLALPESLGVSGPLDLVLTVAAQHVMRSFASRLPGFADSNLPYLYSNFLDLRASLQEEPERRVVHLGRPPLHLILGRIGVTRQSYRVSWLDARPFALFQES